MVAIKETKEDPVQQAATTAIKEFAAGYNGVQLENVPGVAAKQIANELVRIRFEMTAIRKALAVLAARAR